MWRPRPVEGSEYISDNRAVLLTIFKELRKEGYIARANFLCCGGCAAHAIANDVEEMPEKKRNKVQGAIFWHQQDEEDIWRSGSVYLGYGKVTCSALDSDFGLPTVQVGQRIVAGLIKHGLSFCWDGSPDSRIAVHLNKKRDELAGVPANDPKRIEHSAVI